MMKTSGQACRFVVVGILATLLHLLVYYLLNALFGLTERNEVALNVTYAAGYLVSLVANYLLSLRWTFRTQGSLRKSVGFCASHAINLGLHVGLLNFFLWCRMGQALAAFNQKILPGIVECFPQLGQADALLPLPVFVVVVPVNFLLVRFVLTSPDEKKLD